MTQQTTISRAENATDERRAADGSNFPEVSAPSRLDRLIEVFTKELHLDDVSVVAVVAAAFIANMILGCDPAWLLVVGPSSSGKSEILRAFGALAIATMLSTLTSKTFISGAKNGNASLLPELDGKVLILKDFTTILEARREERQEILAQLREIYDGQIAKAFGTGVTVEWDGHLGIVAGVTPAYDRHHSAQAVLGPRFLLYRTAPQNRLLVAAAALRGGSDTSRRKRLSEAVCAALGDVGRFNANRVQVTSGHIEQLVLLADMATRARTPVSREGKSREINETAIPESPARLVKQLHLMAIAQALLEDRSVTSSKDVALAARLALDSISPPLRAQVLRGLAAPSRTGRTTVKEAQKMLGLPEQTVRRALQDLEHLEVLQRGRRGKSHEWMLPEEAVAAVRLDTSGKNEPELKKEK